MIMAAESLQRIPPRDMTIDLVSVTFIDAVAFGALVGLANFQQAQGVPLRVIANNRVRRVASLCGLESLLT